MRLRRLLLMAPFALLPAACATDDADARALLDQVRADDYRRSYARPPGWEMPRAPSDGPHGTHVDIYVDDLVVQTLEERSPSAWPEGSIIVKDGSNDSRGEDLRFVALMEKRGDAWFWAEYDVDDELVVAGLDVDVCSGCHAAGSDGVRAFALPSG